MAEDKNLKYKSKILNWIEKLEQTTAMILSLPDDAKLPNGWTKRELAIHIFTWDNELVEYADNLRKGLPFDWNDIHSEDMDINEVNDGNIEKNKDLTTKEAVETFTKIRQELIDTYKDIVNNYYVDTENFSSYFTMWYHDVHHLKQAGLDTKEIEE